MNMCLSIFFILINAQLSMQYTTGNAYAESCFNHNISNGDADVNIETNAQSSCDNSQAQSYNSQNGDNLVIGFSKDSGNNAGNHIDLSSISSNNQKSNSYDGHNYKGDIKNNIDKNSKSSDIPFTLPFP
jgi:hypothetical protein